MKKLLISYFIGAAVGAAVSAFIFKDYYKNIADEEIKSVKEMTKKKVDEFCEKHFEEKVEEVSDIVKEDTEKAERINYANKYKGGGEEDYILNTLAEKEYPEEKPSKPSKKKNKGAKIIKTDDYDGYPQYRKLTVYYYLGDGVIADEEDQTELLNTAEQSLGKYSNYIPENVINKYGFLDNDDEGVVYIRNEDVRVDFEVIKDFGSFADIQREE